MTRRAINPAGIPSAPTHSQGLEITGARRLLFVSGQVGMRADGTVADGIAEQARQAVANLRGVLAEADMTVDDVVKYTIYLTDPAHVGPFGEAAAGGLPDLRPAATLLVVDQLAAPELLVEIEAVAAAT